MDTAEALTKASVTIREKVDNTPPDIPSDPKSGTINPSDLMMAFFKLNPSDVSKDDVSKMNEIHEFVKSVAGDDEFKQVMVLKDVRFRLGAPRAGMSPLNHLHKYIKLKSVAKQMRTQAKAMEE